MQFQPATLKLMAREWGKALLALACLTLLGFVVGWAWAFVGLSVIWLATLAPLLAALGLMREGRADEAAQGLIGGGDGQ